MTSLQNFINRRATSRSSVAAVRAESPVKHQSAFTATNSHIPLAASRVPSRSTNYSRQSGPELRDDSDDFKDSEILSLENQDGDGYDDDDSNEEDELDPQPENGNFLHDFDRDEVGGRYLVNGKNGAAPVNGQAYHGNGNGNGNGSAGAEAYRWQNGVAPDHYEDDESDDESDGRATPKIRIADEASSDRARTPPDRIEEDLPGEQLQQEQFYTSLEFEDPVADIPLAAASEEARSDPNGASRQTWEDIDREYMQQNKTAVPPVKFNVSGLFEVLKGMGMMLRGTERLVLADHIAHYKRFSIVSPPLPYQILIPYNHSHPLEPTKMLSETATIAFIRRNCPSLPTPEIAYHNLDPNNAANVPFLVIRALKGRSLASLDGGVTAALKDRKRCATLLDGLAKVQSQIMKATGASSITVDRIGNILFRTDAKKPKQSFVIGPCLAADDDSSSDPDSAAPITDLADLCLQVFQSTESSSISLGTASVNHREIRTAKRRLAGLLGLLPPLPRQYAGLTLFHNSLDLSSVLVDPATSAITCVLGFRDVYAVPMALTPMYPAEIRPANGEWTLWTGEPEGKGATVDKYWGLRSIYETRMAKYNALFAGDVWDDEELGSWLQVWEVVNGGVEAWVRKKGWIEVELERLRRL
ncbi:hypothetical protein DRE_04613 [Drechslerella stenobrocha 248]|uniref:Aminoglycoside phosphotransferase domain-containing protein n=1 Tax=Drechslerella stenobrocha 248 TaxID=1043628 RepID=W7HS78_9PEZI|nr:hypothetical protein DRE_04613 [Drechslerella stenobrocha 248]